MAEKARVKTQTENPGRLQGSAALTIHTRQAKQLFYGRGGDGGKPAIFGLVSFGRICKQIYIATSQDNPYGDMFLVNIETELSLAAEELLQFQQRVEQLMQSRPEVNIGMAISESPVEIPVQFGTPYAYMGGYLLSDFDKFVRAVLTAKHVGLMNRDQAEKFIRNAGKVVRRVYAIASKWKYIAVTRDDVRQGTKPAQAAMEAMGDVPATILEGSMRGEHAPDIREMRPKDAAASNQNLSPLGSDIGMDLDEAEEVDHEEAVSPVAP